MPVQFISNFHKDSIKPKQAMLRTRFEYGGFRYLRASYSKDNNSIWPEFELVSRLSGNLKDPIKTKHAMLRTRSNMAFFFFFFGGGGGQYRANNSEVKPPIWLEFKVLAKFYGCPGYLQV